jgi:hypothetical protein
MAFRSTQNCLTIVLLGSLSAQDITWSQFLTPVAPPARVQHESVYDAARQRLIVYGGYGASSGASLSDHWE